VPKVSTTAVPKINGETANATNKITTPRIGETTFVEMIEPSNTPPSFAPIKI